MVVGISRITRDPFAARGALGATDPLVEFYDEGEGFLPGDWVGEEVFRGVKVDVDAVRTVELGEGDDFLGVPAGEE